MGRRLRQIEEDFSALLNLFWHKSFPGYAARNAQITEEHYQRLVGLAFPRSVDEPDADEDDPVGGVPMDLVLPPLVTGRKLVIEQMINLLETGKLVDYSATEILPDGAGITYGRSSATDGGGKLDEIILDYIDRNGVFAADLARFLPLLARDGSRSVRVTNTVVVVAGPNGDPMLSRSIAIPIDVRDLMFLLWRAGRSDPKMRAAQDHVFDVGYWLPAAAIGVSAGLVLPLSYAILYDTAIQSGTGGIARIRALFREVPPSRGGDEKAWATAYVAARETWLAGFVGRDDAQTKIVRSTTYRMAAFREMIAAGRWDLSTPFPFRGQTVPG